MRVLVLGLVVPDRLDPEGAADLVRVRELCAREPPRDREQRARLAGDPRAPLRLEVAVGEVGEERLGLVDEPRRRERLLGLDRGDRLARPVVVLDELGLVLTYPVSERQVAVGEAQRSNRAACPCPTPTQSVANP